MMICLFKLLISRRIFTTIHQKFLTTGHSYLPCDWLFGLIEKKKQRATVIVPSQWMEVVQTTKIPGSTPFICHALSQHQIICLEPLLQLIPRPNTLQVTMSAWFTLVAATPHILECRPDFHPGVGTIEIFREPGHRGRILNRPLWNDQNVRALQLNRKYLAPIPIARAKYEDLMSMVPLIDQQYRQYYEDLEFV